MRRSLGALVLFFLMMSLLPAEASPDHIEQEVWVDTYIEKESSINYGSKDTIIVGKELVTYYVGGTPSATVATQYRILIRPNLTGISGVVTSAKLVLTIAKADPDHDTWIQAYPLTASFDESRVTWYYRDSSNRWSTEGGDYNSSMLLDEVVVEKGASPRQTVELDVTEYVRAVRQGKIKNYGIILLPGPTLGWVEFYSTESSNPRGRPKLVVETSPLGGFGGAIPPPATQPPLGGWTGPVTLQFWYVSVSPSEVTILQGASVAVDVSVETLGVTPTVTLSVSGVPPDCTVSFSQTSGTVPFTTKLMIATSSSTPAGEYNITVQAVSSSGETRSATLSLKVVSTPSPDFRVTVRPPGGAVHSGEAIAFKVAVAPDYGFSRAVTIALSNLPADCSYTVLGGGVPPLEAWVNVSTSETTPPGVYELRVEVRGGGITKAEKFVLVVMSLEEGEGHPAPPSGSGGNEEGPGPGASVGEGAGAGPAQGEEGGAPPVGGGPGETPLPSPSTTTQEPFEGGGPESTITLPGVGVTLPVWMAVALGVGILLIVAGVVLSAKRA